ncbi:MAG TPA: glutamate-5-semialdehyde dehydrogenase [Spirochaetia bacterium]|nr:glutamate-5-semialdehyde dehydrogenase [Spirochaetia bacterium]
MEQSVSSAAQAAKKAALTLQGLSGDRKNQALRVISQELEKQKDRIFTTNRADCARAEKEKVAAPLLKRLVFDQAKLAEALSGLASLTSLPDPVGVTLSARELDAGLELYQVTCPIGVLGIIFESRPDALVQIASLALKSGNAVLLKGGSEARETNACLADILLSAGRNSGLPDGWLCLLESRLDVAAMLKEEDALDLIIPRGSKEFVRHIMDNTAVPVLGHADGICHLYVAADADLDMGVALTLDGKCQYVAVCNALETLLVDEKVAPAFLPRVYAALRERKVEVRGCEKTAALIGCPPATEEDWRTEYLDYILSIKVVSGLSEAVAHINTYGSKHTDSIVTRNREEAARFLDLVDSACVFWNASTRFADGYRFGLGAEVGISTNKIHARGPVGMEGLLIYKWKLLGNGQQVAAYAGPRARAFTHTTLSRPFPL